MGLLAGYLLLPLEPVRRTIRLSGHLAAYAHRGHGEAEPPGSDGLSDREHERVEAELSRRLHVLRAPAPPAVRGRAGP